MAQYGLYNHEKYGVLVKVSVSVKRHHYHGNDYKGKSLIGADLQFRDLVYYHQDRKHADMQVDMVLEKELSVIYVDQQTAGRD